MKFENIVKTKALACLLCHGIIIQADVDTNLPKQLSVHNMWDGNGGLMLSFYNRKHDQVWIYSLSDDELYYLDDTDGNKYVIG